MVQTGEDRGWYILRYETAHQQFRHDLLYHLLHFDGSVAALESKTGISATTLTKVCLGEETLNMAGMAACVEAMTGHQLAVTVPWQLCAEPQSSTQMIDQNPGFAARAVELLQRSGKLAVQVDKPKIRLVFIIDGEAVPVEIEPTDELQVGVDAALLKSYNNGHPLDHWVLRDETSLRLELTATSEALNLPNNVRLFLTPAGRW